MIYIIFQSCKHRRPPLELCVQFPQEFICCTVMIIFYKIKLIHSFHKHKMKIKASIKHAVLVFRIQQLITTGAQAHQSMTSDSP